MAVATAGAPRMGKRYFAAGDKAIGLTEKQRSASESTRFAR